MKTKPIYLFAACFFVVGCLGVETADVSQGVVDNGALETGEISSTDFVSLFESVCLTNFPNHSRTEQNLRAMEYEDIVGMIDEVGKEKDHLENNANGVSFSIGTNQSSWVLMDDETGEELANNYFDSCEISAVLSDPEKFSISLVNQVASDPKWDFRGATNSNSIVRMIGPGRFENEIYVTLPRIENTHCHSQVNCQPYWMAAHIEVFNTIGVSGSDQGNL